MILKYAKREHIFTGADKHYYHRVILSTTEISDINITNRPKMPQMNKFTTPTYLIQMT